jgi:hypothetical protein
MELTPNLWVLSLSFSFFLVREGMNTSKWASVGENGRK